MIHGRRVVAATFTYLIVLLALVTGFFYLHYLGNQLPPEYLHKNLKFAFMAGDLIPHPKPFNEFGSLTVRSLIGQDQHSDCQTYQHMLAPKHGTIREAVILEKTITNVPRNHCQSVLDAHTALSNGEGFETERLRTRYWWGWVAIHALLLKPFTIFHINQGIKLFTYFGYLLLGLAAAWHSWRMLALLAPVIVIGFLFSGIPYYGGVALALGYLWAVVAITTVVLMLAARARPALIRLFFFIAGAISAFLSTFDGHLMLLLPVSLSALFFGLPGDHGTRDRLLLVTACLTLFVVGFTGSLLLNQLVKSYYVGLDSVIANFSSGLSHRMSGAFQGSDIDSQRLFQKLFHFGYGRVGAYQLKWLYQFLVNGALSAAGIAIVITAINAWRHRSWLPFAGIGFLTGMLLFILVRIEVFSNHSWIHYHFIGRYMFVILAIYWMMLVYSLQQWHGNRIDVQDLQAAGAK